jgi:hypothetical protein
MLKKKAGVNDVYFKIFVGILQAKRSNWKTAEDVGVNIKKYHTEIDYEIVDQIELAQSGSRSYFMAFFALVLLNIRFCYQRAVPPSH